jgi:hypothetical protein
MAHPRTCCRRHESGRPPCPRCPEGHRPAGDPASLSLSFLIREPAAVYHAKARDHLSSHALGDFRRCPLLYRRKRQGLITEPDRSAYVVGRAAHVLTLEGRERYRAEYAVGGPVNPRTGEPFGPTTKAFQKWAARCGKAVLGDADAATVERMAGSVKDHIFARELLAEGVAEGVVRVEYDGHACQGRLDWLNPIEDRGIVDLKTCQDLDGFEAQVRDFGYAHQLAFYRELVRRACGHALPVHLIAVEKREPFRCGVWRIDDELLESARRDNEHAMAALTRCCERDTWPTGYESLRLLTAQTPTPTPTRTN